MQAYKVIGRAHRRTSMLNQEAIATDGTRIQVKQAGPMVSYQVGDVIEDIRLDELEAFPDRFQAATSAEVDAWHERQSHMPAVMRAPGMTAEQAVMHADLTRQIAELEAKQQALLTEANTPILMDIDMPDHELGRSSRGSRGGALPASTPLRGVASPTSTSGQGHAGTEPEAPLGRGPHAGPVPAAPVGDTSKK